MSSLTTLTDDVAAKLAAAVTEANREVAARYPGESTSRQPVHTVYGGAHLFTADLAVKLGATARQVLQAYAPDPPSLAAALHLTSDLAESLYPRIVDKLTHAPVEDFRIDFEDGFGTRSDDEEDRWARRAGRETAAGLAAGTLPGSIGIRIKTLSEELKRRSLRTLDLFLTSLLEHSGGALPPYLAITLPKITGPAQVAALAATCDAIERARGLKQGVLRIELMVETPQTIFASDGTVALPRLVAAGQGRVDGAHFGTYDYTASQSITAAHQHMRHPACDFAKQVMKVALAGLPVRLSDGATNVLPVPPHRESDGVTLSAEQRRENADVVHRAWRLHMADIRHSLAGGFYQGWDLHPAQLPTRHAAVFAFFLSGLEAASDRLRNFVKQAAQATLVGDVFDDAATGQGLLNYFLRAVNCGAVSETEAAELSGLTIDDLRGRSFAKILANRRSGA
jgi:citrate lyase beta subunit